MKKTYTVLIEALTYFIKIKRKLSGDATVKSCLQVSGPILAEDVLPARVPFADSRHPRVDRLAAVDVLYGGLPEEEQHIFTHVEGTHEVWF